MEKSLGREPLMFSNYAAPAPPLQLFPILENEPEVLADSSP